MAEIFGNGGDPVTVSGDYECSECGHRARFNKGDAFPADHHPDKPWTLFLATEEIPAQQTSG